MILFETEPDIAAQELAVSKRKAVTVEQLAIGRLIDPQTGQPTGLAGLTVTRRSTGLSADIAAHAQPQSLIGQLDTAPDRIAGSAQETGALVVYPVFARTPDGLAGWKVVACRLGVQRVARGNRDSSTFAANAYVFDWATWARSGHSIGPALASALQLERATTADTADARLAAPPPRVAFEIRPEGSNHPPDVARIVAAIEAGERLVLGSETCQSEFEFLQLMGAALAALPENMRGHISFASGYVRHEDGIQIVWLPDQRFDDQPLAVSQAPAEVAILADGPAPAVSGDRRRVGAQSLVNGKRRLMRSVRIAVAQRLRAAGRPPAATGAAGPSIDVATLLQRRWLPPKVLEQVMVSPEIMEELAQRVLAGDRGVIELVLLSGAIADHAGASFAGRGAAFVQALAPTDEAGRTMGPVRLRDASLLAEVVRSIDVERMRLAGAGKTVPRWLTAARRSAAAAITPPSPAPRAAELGRRHREPATVGRRRSLPQA